MADWTRPPVADHWIALYLEGSQTSCIHVDENGTHHFDGHTMDQVLNLAAGHDPAENFVVEQISENVAHVDNPNRPFHVNNLVTGLCEEIVRLRDLASALGADEAATGRL